MLCGSLKERFGRVLVCEAGGKLVLFDFLNDLGKVANCTAVSIMEDLGKEDNCLLAV